MTHTVFIVLGLGLLLFPLWLLRARGSRLAGFDQREWPKGRNLLLFLVDALRSSGAVWLLMQGLPGLKKVPGLGVWQDAAVLGGAIAIGLLVQAFAWRDEDFAFAPVPYMLGLLSIIAHPIVLVIVLPLALGASMALRAWAAGLLACGAGLAAVGLAVTQQDWRVGLLVGVAFFMPVLGSVMAGRHLGWPRK